MAKKQFVEAEFEKFIKSQLKPGEDSVPIGKPMYKRAYDGEIALPLKMLSRHGLISGSTGTGKSRSAQYLCEQLSLRGIPTLLSDVKGDVSGFIKPGEGGKVAQRVSELGYDFQPRAFQCNYFGISQGLIPLRVKLGDLDAVLVSKFLGLNETQESHLTIAWIYAHEQSIPLEDLESLEHVLTELRDTKIRDYPGLQAKSIDIILRKILELKSRGMNEIFGEPSTKIEDLILNAKDGQGIINLLNLSPARDRPEVFTALVAFVLWRIFRSLPDMGEQDRPKLVVFFDEAHYLFKDSNKSLVKMMATMLRQIRSKGVGVFFLTQDPEDLPGEILEQLGCKIEYAMRAFTQRDLENVRAMSKGFPISDFYDIEEELKSMGTGISMLSFLNDRGQMVPPVQCAWYPPASYMGKLSDADIWAATKGSPLYEKYKERRRKSILRKVLPIRKEPEAAAAEAAPVMKVQRRRGEGHKIAIRVLKALGKALKLIAKWLIWIPLKKFGKWLIRKPKRLAWFILILIALGLIWWKQTDIRAVLKILGVNV